MAGASITTEPTTPTPSLAEEGVIFMVSGFPSPRQRTGRPRYIRQECPSHSDCWLYNG
jgi:hypothetical protein